MPPGFPWPSPTPVTFDQIDQMFEDQDHSNRASPEVSKWPREGEMAANSSNRSIDKSSHIATPSQLPTPADSSPHLGASDGLPQPACSDGVRSSSTAWSRTDRRRTPEADFAENPVTPVSSSSVSKTKTKSKDKTKSKEKTKSKRPKTSHTVRSPKPSDGLSRTSKKESRDPSASSTQNSMPVVEKKEKKNETEIVILEDDDEDEDAPLDSNTPTITRINLFRRHTTAPPPSLRPMSPAVEVKAAMTHPPRAPLLSLTNSNLNKRPKDLNLAALDVRIDEGHLSDAELFEIARSMPPQQRRRLAPYAFKKSGALYAVYHYLVELTDKYGQGLEPALRKRLTRM
ncbi:MAG: hypothetical protein Q9224_007119 [Gallowayella concinna]